MNVVPFTSPELPPVQTSRLDEPWQALSAFDATAFEDEGLAQQATELKRLAEALHALRFTAQKEAGLKDWKLAFSTLYSFPRARLSARDADRLAQLFRLCIGFNAVAWL